MSNSSTNRPYPLLAAGFANSARLFPENKALHINGRYFTYAELLAKTEIIFSQLESVAVPDFIGIYTQESVWTYAAILAISLSGACYVPLNSKLPKQKLSSLVDECGLSLVVSEEQLAFITAEKQLVLDTSHTVRKKPVPLVHSALAYLLFTSGTTGAAKGVPVSKENAQAFFEHCTSAYHFLESDRFLQPYELSFDVSVFSLFAAWNVGASVYVVPDAGAKYLNVAATIRDHQITVSSMVPTVLLYLEKYLPEFSFPALRYSFFSGDKLFQHLAAKWQLVAPNAQIHNCYGPTETTIVCTGYHWRAGMAEQEAHHNIVPLGKPFSSMDFLLLDEDAGNEDSVGELCFTGAQVIPSYLNQAHEDCFFLQNGKRYYRTGDLASINAFGNLIFHGRKDAQVKINGYRVELAEVEQALVQCLGKQVMVLAAEEQGLMVLAAFIEALQIDEAKLKKDVAELLPSYMIPARLILLPVFPRNLNNKIDRERLKEKL